MFLGRARDKESGLQASREERILKNFIIISGNFITVLSFSFFFFLFE